MRVNPDSIPAARRQMKSLSHLDRVVRCTNLVKACDLADLTSSAATLARDSGEIVATTDDIHLGACPRCCRFGLGHGGRALYGTHGRGSRIQRFRQFGPLPTTALAGIRLLQGGRHFETCSDRQYFLRIERRIEIAQRAEPTVVKVTFVPDAGTATPPPAPSAHSHGFHPARSNRFSDPRNWSTHLAQRGGACALHRRCRRRSPTPGCH